MRRCKNLLYFAVNLLSKYVCMYIKVWGAFISKLCTYLACLNACYFYFPHLPFPIHLALCIMF